MSEDALTYEAVAEAFDNLWRQAQLPYRDVWVHHPKDIRIGAWQREYDYSKWNETTGLNE